MWTYRRCALHLRIQESGHVQIGASCIVLVQIFPAHNGRNGMGSTRPYPVDPYSEISDDHRYIIMPCKNGHKTRCPDKPLA